MPAPRIVTIDLDKLARALQAPHEGESADGSIILVDEAAAYVDKAGQTPGTWWPLNDGPGGGDHYSLSLGEILGYDEVPEDRKPRTYELLYSADDVLRLIEQLGGVRRG
jgi:hypothetical protein